MKDEESDSIYHRARTSSRKSARDEFDFIDSIRHKALRRRQKYSSLTSRPSSLLHGIGDDAAVIEQRGRSNTVITSDLLVEDIDFRLKTTSPRLLGHKALAVSLSDIAAMGARPRWALLSIGVPRPVWRSRFLDQFYDGFFALAARYNVALVGGDVSRTPERVIIDSIVIGETAQGRAVLRSGARPGDHIFVTGWLGGAAAGLRLLEQDGRLRRRGSSQSEKRVSERLILRHLCPEPRVEWGEAVGLERLATAMIDISDGLSSDLAHLCSESGVGARIDAARIPVNPLIARTCEEHRLNPLELALDGGEDFELLFTVRPRNLRRLPKIVAGVPAAYIGDVTTERGRVMLREGAALRLLKPKGYVHFD